MTRINIVDPASFLTEFPTQSERLSALKKTRVIFPTWKTITLGTRESPDAFKREHKKNGRRVSADARDVMAQPTFTLTQSKTKLELVKIRLYDFCFIGASLREICDRTIELGLKPCPAEAGPELWRQHAKQLDGERLHIAMQAIVASDGNPYIFVIEDEEYGQILDAEYALPQSGWSVDDRFIVCK